MRRAEKTLQIAHFSRDFGRNFSGWIFVGGEEDQGNRLGFSEIAGK
jgi:hypothetical protein